MMKYALLGLSLIWVALTIRSIVKGIQRHRLEYAIKKLANELRPALTIVWTAYFFVLSVNLVPPIEEFTDKAIAMATSPEAAFFFIFTPVVYVGTIMWVAYEVFLGASKPFINYTDEEKVWLQEDKLTMEKRLRKLMFWKRGKV